MTTATVLYSTPPYSTLLELSMAGPTFINPHLGTGAEDGWAMGFTWGFLGPAFSSDPPLVIAPELLDAFNEGVLAGQAVAISGIAIEPACCSLLQHTQPGAEDLMHGVHILEGLGLIRSLGHLAHFSTEALFAAFLFMIPGPPSLQPVSEFMRIGGNVRDRLTELGLAGNSLFIAAGIDEAVEACELLFTPVFTNIDFVRDAVVALGRTQWVIAQWDADAPVSGGGFTLVESSGS